MDETTLDQGREATAVQDLLSTLDGAESLLNELTGSFDDTSSPAPPPPPVAEPVAVLEEVTVASPPRIEPPVMIWKPERRLRFRLRRR
jgi:hypothetical protein